MFYIECPERLPTQYTKSVFLAGGITGCPDWQQEVVAGIGDLDIVIYNPRRENFPINDPTAAKDQIEWEAFHMKKADIISFWFCKETIQPIVLFEFGHWLYDTTKTICIGMDKDYFRKQDIEIQTSIVRPRLAYDISLNMSSHIERLRYTIDKFEK